MKPSVLKMTAFCSYAEETTVDFDLLSNGLYLITGDTGAGKTTIFDALLFALYGVASGNSRTVEMLHSDYSEKSVDTKVELTFLHGGKNYRVERKLHYSKSHETGQYDGKPKKSATLYEDERNPIEGDGNVTARIKELTGLDESQFQQTVMLAQGEFMKFLAAEPSERQSIVGKLFDSSPYKNYASLLAASSKLLAGEREEQRNSLKHLMENSFIMPEGLSEEDKALFSPAHPSLCEALGKLVESDNEKLEKLTERKNGAEKEISALASAITAAEHVNADFYELKKAEDERIKIESYNDKYDEVEAKRDLAERALHRVRPTADRRAAAEKAVTENRARLNGLIEKSSVLTALREEKKAAFEKAFARTEEAEKEEAAASEISKTVPLYKEADALKNEAEKAKKTYDVLSSDERAAKEDAENARRVLAETEKELALLSGCDAEKERLFTEKTSAAERLEAIAGTDGLTARIKKYRSSELSCADIILRMETAKTESENAHKRYIAMQNAFIGGSAARISAQLRKKLDETGECDCPVCGTKLDKNTRLAHFSADIPSQDEMDKALEEEKKAVGELNRLNGEAVKAADWLDAEKTDILSRCDKLGIDCEGGIPSEEIQTKELNSAKKNLQELSAAFTEAEKKCTRAKKLEELIKNTDLAGKEKTAAEKSAAAAEAKNTLDVLSGRLNEKKKGLIFANADEAEKEAEKHSFAAKEIRREIETARAALEAAERGISENTGLIGSTRETLEKAEKTFAEADSDYVGSLVNSGFSSEKAYFDALSVFGGTDGEKWLSDALEKINAFKTAKAVNLERLNTYREKTKDKTFTDIEALKKQKTEATDRAAALDTEFTGFSAVCANHRDVLSKAEQIRKKLAGSEGLFRTLDKLSAVANGYAEKGGKYSFDAWMLGSGFKEILEAGNKRLSVMSGGKYELIHRTDADRANSAAGFNIDVLDLMTGKQRKAGSLSGGEKFEVSLALALGLSDAASAHSGNADMSSMFIDEGFGSLSSNELDKAIEVLYSLAGSDRKIGIISHIEQLETIPQKIRVTRRGDKESTLKIVSE